MKKSSWTKSEAAQALGLTPRTIHFYTDEGLLTPEIENPKGKGTTRRYSVRNLLELLVIKELSRYLELKDIKELVTFPQEADEKSRAFDPWDPQAVTKDGIRDYLICYDARTDHQFFHFTWTEREEDLHVDMANRRHPRGAYSGRRSSAIVIDITSLKRRVAKLL